MHKVFTYGTLILPEITRDVLGRIPKSHGAVLDGYSRYCMKNRSYPGVVEEKGSFVEGVLYENVSDLDIEKLDTFEGVEYIRREVMVRCYGASVRAYCYIVTDKTLLTPTPWSLEDLFRNGISRKDIF